MPNDYTQRSAVTNFHPTSYEVGKGLDRQYRKIVARKAAAHR